MEPLKPVQTLKFMETFPLNHYVLENGLEIFLLHNPISPVVSYLTHYTVGSASETEQERGLAHFFEHMMFRETRNLADGDFDRIMAEAGGVGLNAYTTYDHTAYYVSVPTAQLQRVIDLEAERMANLVLSPELIEAERGAVLGEMRMYQDMPSEQLWNTMAAEAFPTHPYRHPIIGYEQQVQDFKGPDFQQFYQSHYAPNRAVIVVAGGFDEPTLVAQLQSAYGDLKPGIPRREASPPDKAWSQDRRLELSNGKISAANLMMATQTPEITHDDTPALQVLSALLSAGQSSPLYLQLVQSGLTTHVSAGNLATEMVLSSPGLFLIDAGLRHGVNAEQAEQAIMGVLETLGKEAIAAPEMERALNQIQLGNYAGLRSNNSMARQVGGHAVACGDPCYGEKLLRRMEKVTPGDLQRVLRQYVLQAPRLTIVQNPAQNPAQNEGMQQNDGSTLAGKEQA